MIKQFVITTIIGLCVSITTDAQTFTQRLETPAKGGATVTVHHDKAIDELVNAPHSVATPVTVKKPLSEVKTTVAAEKKTVAAEKKTIVDKPAEHAAEGSKHVAAVDTLGGKKSSSHSIKTIGYRVQVFAGGNSRKDRQTAERIGNELRMLFPTEAVYVHFYPPRWICRMGNYRTQEEAHKSLLEVKKLGYNAATIVKGKITIQY